MYSILHELDDATSVHFSAWGQFLPGTGRQLATVGSKCLKFYRLNPYYCETSNEENEEQRTSTRLECMLSFTLMAPVRSMAVVRLKANPECNSLAMTFDDAKLSIVSVNPATMGLNTISLHSIEDDFLRDGYTSDIHNPELRADPDNRCCAFTVYRRHLAVVPFQPSSEQAQQQLAATRDGRQAQMLLQSYTIKLRSLDDRLDNIVDMCFLHGYYEPTLLFLYEPIQTTAGRACVRYDTIAILAVSLNIKDRVHAVVWNFAGLPMTVHRCVPIRQPIGGVCLVGANEIVYLNQSVPPRGISLNSCSTEFSRFPLCEQQQHLRISLDGSAIQAMDSPSNDLLLVLRNGDLYILTLEADHANMVRELRLTKAFTTSIPCCLTVCAPNYLFVGSRLGDSQLLRFSTEQRRKTSGHLVNGNGPVHRASLLFDEDDIFLYGHDFCDSFQFEESHKHSLVARHYRFELVDSLTNIGPCKWLRTCSPTCISDTFQKKPRDVYFDMMTASGHGKDSSLCFFHRTIRPQIITSTHLDEAQQIWTIGRHRDGQAHKYLLISRERSSVVLELENDNMVELDGPLFCLNETTVTAGELVQGSVVVQVTPTTVLLVSALTGQQLEMLMVDSNFPVINASIVDPYVVLLTLNGRFLLYRVVTSPSVLLQQIPVLEVLKHSKSPVTAQSLYRDQSGIMAMCSEEEPMDQSAALDEPQPLALNVRLFTRSTDRDTNEAHKAEQGGVGSFEDGNAVETFLYGDDKIDDKSGKSSGGRARTDHPRHSAPSPETTTDNQHPDSESDFGVQHPSLLTLTYWLFLARENGNLYIYSVPDLKLLYIVKKLSQIHEVLYGDAQSVMEDDLHRPHHAFMSIPMILPQPQGIEAARAGGAQNDLMVKPEEIIVELHVHGMGINKGRPVLSALIDDQVVFYEMFRRDDRISGQLAIRFRRLPATVVVREQRFLGPNGRAPVEAARDVEERHRQCICPFERVGKMSNGLFICGGYPSVLLIDRGEPRLHPMTIDGPVASFVPFNNSSSCHNGFLYLTRAERLMRIGTLTDQMDYDAAWPRRKVLIHQTIRHCVFLLQPGIFALTLSEPRPNQKQCSVVNEDKQMDTFERDDNFILPTLDFYTLKLFSTEDWKFVPNGDFEFDEFEVVTCCEEVLLNSESTESGVQNYLAVGTSLNYGEEVYVRGRVVLFELVEVVPEEDQPTTRHRLKTVYDKEQKGPVTSLCAVNGFLLTGMGQKVFIWQFRDNQLHGVSFLDLHFYVHHMTNFRELAVVCDLYRSLSLIRYQEEFKALSLVSRDLRPTAPLPMTAHFLVDHRQLGIVLTDEMANVTLFNYLPETKESIGGERLIIKAALNVGSLINAMVRVKGHVSECLVDGEHQQGTQTCFFATLDGTLGYIRPLTEKVFRRLHMLQQVMNLHVPQCAGLNPKGARATRPQRTGTNQQMSSAKNIVDGLLVMQYLHLSGQEKTDLARKLGTSRYQIIDDLTELCRSTAHF